MNLMMKMMIKKIKYIIQWFILCVIIYIVHLTIQINNDFVLCQRKGWNIKMERYDGFIHSPDYNLICLGTVVFNDIIKYNF